ncbi:uncharacterized protein F54H12.2-like [Anneissia japonica]|uniref:uncharacterized protein F54H12.2-like n=1 Tax=Anneissia japonica TaxID=1529436 RepID=UPI00142595D4|nr:uncharacterized protein F54H12.2-like [Anneissia japonica]
MAYVHKNICECLKSELGLFSVPPTQTSITKGQWVQYFPYTSISDSGPVQFNIQGSSEEYVDLGQTMLRVKAKITKSDGTDLDADDPVGPSNLLLQSLFSEVDISLNERLITPSTNTYSYRAMIETLLTYGTDAKQTHLTGGLFYKDTASRMDAANPTVGNAVANNGLKKRSEFTNGSRLVDLIGPIHCDIFFQDRMMLNGVDVKIKLHRSKNSFCLMSPDAAAGFKVHLEDASVYVRKVKLNPSIALAHAKALEKGTAKYPLRRVEVKTLSVPQGNLSFTRESLYNGNLPKRLVIGLVGTDAFNGSYSKNPYNFQHFNTNFMALYLDGEQVPWKPLKPNFEANGEGSYILAYQSLFSGLSTLFEDTGNQISREDYARGYSLFAFDLTPDLSNSGHFNLIKRGNIRLEIQFATALTETINVIIYSEFDSLIEIVS